MCDAHRRVSWHHFATADFADRISLIFKWDFPNLNTAIRINLRSIRKSSADFDTGYPSRRFFPFAALRWPSAPPRAPIGGFPLHSRCSPIAVPTYVSAPPGSQTTPSRCTPAIYSSDPGGWPLGFYGRKTRAACSSYAIGRAHVHHCASSYWGNKRGSGWSTQRGWSSPLSMRLEAE